jgi:hypothetical protein
MRKRCRQFVKDEQEIEEEIEKKKRENITPIMRLLTTECPNEAMNI